MFHWGFGDDKVGVVWVKKEACALACATPVLMSFCDDVMTRGGNKKTNEPHMWAHAMFVKSMSWLALTLGAA